MTIDTASIPSTDRPYSDRRGWLIFFGILLIALGALTLLMTALTAASLFLPKPPGAPAGLPARLMIPIVAIYLGLAVWFIALGIGSMLPRRWAWALLVVQSWIWLVFGLLTIAMMATMARAILPPMPPGQEGLVPFIVGCMAVFAAIFFVALPITFVLFYRSPNVKATVWARDPRPRWTDRIPLPVLGGGLLLTASGVMIPMVSGSYRGIPFGGIILRGWPAAAILVAFAALAVFGGIQLLRLKTSGWWATLLFVLTGMAFAAAFSRTDPTKWPDMLAFNLPADQVARTTAMYRSPLFLVWMAVIWIAYAAYLVYIRRYFFRRD